MARGFVLVLAVGLFLAVHTVVSIDPKLLADFEEALAELENDHHSEGAAIKCYQCNSATNKDCGDPVTHDAIASSVVECTPDIAKEFLNNAASVAKALANSFGSDLFPQGTVKMEMACHKLKKKVNDDEVVIRTCAPGGSVNICKDSKDLFCEQCDKDLCNGAERLGGLPVLFYVLLPCIIALLAIRA